MKFLLPLLLLAGNVGAQIRTDLEKGFSHFLAGDSKTAHSYLTKVIARDSLVYEAYYFRGIMSLWQNDTVATIQDFDRAMYLKLQGRQASADSLFTYFIRQKPERPSVICGYWPNQGLFELQVATWHILENREHETACGIFKSASVEMKAARVLKERACQ